MTEPRKPELGFRVSGEWLIVKMRFFHDPRTTSKELLEFVRAVGAARKRAANLLLELGETDADFWVFNFVAACEQDGMHIYANAPLDCVIRRLFDSTRPLVRHHLTWVDDVDTFMREKGLQLPSGKTSD